jgi:hypothetical protein
MELFPLPIHFEFCNTYRTTLVKQKVLHIRSTVLSTVIVDSGPFVLDRGFQKILDPILYV